MTRQTTRHGKRVYYFRKGKGKRTRLPHLGSSEFSSAYKNALLEMEIDAPNINYVAKSSLEYLISQYRVSSAYLTYSIATRRQRDNIFKNIISKNDGAAGKFEYRKITRKMIIDGREDRKATPHQARHFLDAMRGLFRWALDNEYVSEDPTRDVKYMKTPKTDGFPVWKEDDVKKYEDYWALGTRQRVWMAVMLYTGVRRGDAVRINAESISKGFLTLKTSKTGTIIQIPILAELDKVIKAGGAGDDFLIVGVKGHKLTKESFGNAFAAACDAAGVGKRGHGLRKIGAHRAAEGGATEHELMAVYGWTDIKTALIYTKGANRKRMATNLMEKVYGYQAPHPKEPLPSPKK